VAGSTYLAKLLRGLPGLVDAKVTAEVNLRACLQMIDLYGSATADRRRAPFRSAVLPLPQAKRVLPTREERLRREDEKKERELADCRYRSAQRHGEQRRQAAIARRGRAVPASVKA
jgi:hypothetical protein